MEDDYAIGLYIGTTFSYIGVYRNGGVEIIPNSIGEKMTPSVLIFTDKEILVGEDTIDILIKNPENYIYEVKRLIGVNYDDYKNEINKPKYKVVKLDKKDLNNYVHIEVNMNKKIELFSPLQLISLIIKKLISNAEIYLKKEIKKLVITVPSYYNEDQRRIIKHAVELLGLDVIKIINESTAACISI